MDADTGLLATVHDTCASLYNSIDFSDRKFKIALFCVAFQPTFWNIVSRAEYHTHFLSKAMRGRKRGCYAFASVVFSFGLIRNYFFEKTLRNQDYSSIMQSETAIMAGLVLVILGQILVLSSAYQLGIIGTYCGDHFGILMKERVTKFPFNICNNPMYRGSTITFLGSSLMSGKPVGLLITLFVHLCYEFSIKFEEPFTTKMYETKNDKKD